MIIISYEEVQLDRCVVALGKFQGVHKGHMLLIDKVVELSRQEGIPGVVFSIDFHNDLNIYADDKRYELFSELGVDIVVSCDFSPEFAALEPETFISDILFTRLHAKYIIVGEDFRFGRNRSGGVNELVKYEEKYDYSTIVYDKLCCNGTEISSSYIRKLIADSDFEQLKEFMGRDYSICGVVCEGKKLGRTIGFPTINIKYDGRQVLPGHGVYETRVVIDDREYRGITNIGNNPTVDESGRVFIETHILDFNENIYGKYVTIVFKRFIRPEKKFKDVDELKLQIKKDIIGIMHQ